MGYTRRMFASKFNGLGKSDLVFLENGSIVIENQGDVQEFEEAGIGLTSDEIYLIKTKSFGRIKFKKRIALGSIKPKSIEIDSARNFDKENKIAGISVIAGQGPFTSLKFEKTILQFATEEENFVLEIPQNQKVKMKFEGLMSGENEVKEEEEDSINILEKRFARGEISEKEFESKKELINED